MRLLGAALALVALAGCGGVGTGGLAEGGSVSQGQQLFGPNCGSCHTLAHANTKGTIGPNLDAAFVVLREKDYDESTIREIVHKQIKYPVTDPPTGVQGMPADIVEGEDAEAVAAYVACAAGLWAEQAAAAGCGTAAGAGGGGNGPAALFAANCASCHALEAANASGTIGPNLDESDVSQPDAVKQITGGGGGMPAFGDQFQRDQIEALARYIVENRG